MRKKFKVTVLSDNRKLDETLESEHGLCVFLDTGKFKILLDTGASGLFIQNAERLGIDVREIDYVFISHGHADHIGGLIPFMEINSKAKILLSEKALNQRFFSIRNGYRNIGIDSELGKYKERCVFIERETHFDGDISIFPCDSTSFFKPIANVTLFKDSGNGLELDDFSHELVFCCGADDLFVYTGCAHKGLLNILDSVKKITGKNPGVVLGGFHLLDSRPEQLFETKAEIVQIGEFLRDNYPETRFITGHCTGSHTLEILKTRLNQQIESFYTGFTTKF
jgi:7,8-dihydropterin-6-yl-methyl-4-(beta-D-ribofuranosyl)aminobenzene 5'-phosphate synthase